jgi:hypothetical protein
VACPSLRKAIPTTPIDSPMVWHEV